MHNTDRVGVGASAAATAHSQCAETKTSLWFATVWLFCILFVAQLSCTQASRGNGSGELSG